MYCFFASFLSLAQNYGCVKELLGTCEESCPTCICPVIEPARTPCRCEGAKIDNAHCCRDKHPESRCHIFVCKDWVWQCEEGCH